MAVPVHVPLAAQLSGGEGDLLVGDIGLIALKALLENGTACIVADWIDPDNPIDAAIADAKDGALLHSGTRLRERRSTASIELAIAQTVTVGRAPGGAGEHPRVAVVIGGRSGRKPLVDQLAAHAVTTPVIAFTFDADAARSADAIVVDPEPTPRGLVEAIDTAYAISQVVRSIVFILLGTRACGIRGAMRCRDNLRPTDAPLLDPETGDGVGRDEAIRVLTAPPVRIVDKAQAAVICPAAAFAATCRALGDLPVSVVGIVTTRIVGDEIDEAVTRVDRILVIDQAGGLAERVGARVNRAGDGDGRVRIRSTRIDRDAATDADIVAAVAAWIRVSGIAGDAESVTDAAGSSEGHPSVDPHRLLRRGAALARPLPPGVSAALVMAQERIGVPTRVDDEHPTYLTQSGAMLTIATGDMFLTDGLECAGEDGRCSVFVVVSGDVGAIAAQAASVGATVEAIDTSHPRRAAAAIAAACAVPPIRPHVICCAVSTPIVPAAATVSAEPELGPIDAVTASVFDDGSLALVGNASDPSRPPHRAIVPGAMVGHRLSAATELSGSWYDVRAWRQVSVGGRVIRSIRRRALRSIARMEV